MFANIILVFLVKNLSGNGFFVSLLSPTQLMYAGYNDMSTLTRKSSSDMKSVKL